MKKLDAERRAKEQEERKMREKIAGELAAQKKSAQFNGQRYHIYMKYFYSLCFYVSVSVFFLFLFL